MSDMRATVDLPRMTARLSYPHSNQREPDHYATIRIEDEDSGQEIAKIELNPDQLFRLMSGNQAYGCGRATARSDRLGRKMVRRTVHLNRKEWGLEYDSTVEHPAIRAHFSTLHEVGWEIVQHECKRGEHYITATKWVEVETGAMEPATDDRGADSA